MHKLIERTTTEMNGYGWDNIGREKNQLFISNHRDIVLDAAFLNMLMFDKEKPTTEIAIGDNLLIYPWIERLVRLNKSFIVKRVFLSADAGGIHTPLPLHPPYGIRAETTCLDNTAGRRAKDSDDKTQVTC